MAKLSKRSKKFASSGGVKKAIAQRRKRQQTTKRVRLDKEKRAAKSKVKARERPESKEIDEASDGDDVPEGTKFQGMSVDDFLQGDFMDEDGSKSGGSDAEEDDDDDGSSLASVEEWDDEEQHALDLAALAKKDPEFYKYLEENDKELLDFAPVDGSDDEQEAMMDDDEESGQQLFTADMLKELQKPILHHRSLKALQKLLQVFRSASTGDGETTGADGYKIESPEGRRAVPNVVTVALIHPAVFNKLVTTALKYTPIVLKYHIPYKELPDGRFKPPAKSRKSTNIGKLAIACILGTVRITSQVSDPEMHALALGDSMKLVPYVTESRKTVRTYLKMCLELWASGKDEVKLAAFLALRKLGSSFNTSLLNMVLKASYLTMVRAMGDTNEHTIPALNLMKNTASELYCLDQATSYSHAFVYIRQLAVHLRTTMKVKSKDALRKVYNWQFVHCIDFWSIVLAKACGSDNTEIPKEDAALRPLIYPLVQVTIGAIKLASGIRYSPIHIHFTRSLLTIIRHTKTYVPLAPFILSILTIPLSPDSKWGASTLKPIDFTTNLRIPNAYMKTKVLSAGVVEECTFLLGEWCECVHGSIAFPELMIPVLATLKRTIKKSKGGKGVMDLKVLVERIEESCRWVETRRSTVKFAPGDGRQVADWQRNIDISETPVAKWVRVQRKARANREELRKKAASGTAEMLDSEDDSPNAHSDDDMEDDSGGSDGQD
ncbi:Nucleolar Complex 2 protein [Tulasnella sp. 403]|nr:Nucleolar Complex 2 protein [Tulasnella sp. 403]